MKVIDKSKLPIAFTDKSLCTRCGTCIGVCPTQALSIGPDFYPLLDPDKCTECDVCVKTCPGGSVNFKELAKITFDSESIPETFDGQVQRTFVGYSGDKKIRSGGAGGGVITGLFWNLLDRGIVDGCLVTRMNPEKPYHGEPFIATTYDELLQSQQSKYIVIPTNAILDQLEKKEGKFAFAGLPCQIHGLRLAMNELPELKEKIHVIVGLFCASAMEPFVAKEMLQCRGIDENEISNFHFRGGVWPGRHRAIFPDGQVKDLHYSNFKDGAINYLTYLYSPFRCQTCIDGSAEFSDISVSDAWTRDEQGNYLFGSQSKLLARTDRGVEVMEKAIATKGLIAKDATQNKHYQTHKLHTRKKGLTAPLRVERLKKNGHAVPVYDRPCPESTRNDLILERVESGIMFLGKHRGTRYPLFKFLTSRYGIPLVKIRQFIKSRKYRKKF